MAASSVPGRLGRVSSESIWFQLDFTMVLPERQPRRNISSHDRRIVVSDEQEAKAKTFMEQRCR